MKTIGITIALLAAAHSAAAQEHDHAKMLRDLQAAAGWQLTQDGDVFLMFNHQSGDRGGNEFVAPNWWMLMAARKTSHGTISFNGNDFENDRTTTVEIKEVGSTKVEVPEEAKKKLS